VLQGRFAEFAANLGEIPVLDMVLHDGQCAGSRSDLPPVLRELPSWWFGELDRALEQGEFDVAAEAARELRRLGVEVRYTRPGGQEVPDERV